MSIRKSILFGLALINEIIYEFRDPGGYVSFSYKNLYGFVPESYKKENIYSLTNKLKKEGKIEFVSKGNFKLTKFGISLIEKEFFPLLKFINKPWDGKWRIVGFDIEEKKRNLRTELRKFLNSFGFGMLQKSLYISPLPIEKEINEFISLNSDLLFNTYIFVSDKFFFEDKESFIGKVFCLEEVNKNYKYLLEKIKKGEDRNQILREFLYASSKDPFLPGELTPPGFLRDEVWTELEGKGIIT